MTGLRFIKTAIFVVMAVMFFAHGARAKPTTPEQAQTVVLNWLSKDAAPLGASLGLKITEVQTFNNKGTAAYYVVYLNPAGMVFLPADDLVEPIIAFMPSGKYDPSPTNPLGAMLSQDIPGRVLQAQAMEAMGLEDLAPETPQAKAQRKWNWLAGTSSAQGSLMSGIPSPLSDVRVDSLVQSYWWQGTVAGQACFNYYTPPNSAGDANNYICGCIATVMAQLMRYHQYPANGVGSRTLTLRVDWVERPAQLRGGNGTGGPYDWTNTILVPNSGMNETQRQALGALTYDAGVSVNMNYRSDGGPSTSDSYKAAGALVNVFQYSNAKYSYNNGDNIPLTNLYAMTNPNLDQQLPVQLGLNGPDGGHAILTDGYGYNAGTMYHHLKMGWPETGEDVWYNLPNIDAKRSSYNIIHTCVYNVFKSGKGEIISGRVTTAGKTPISGATVTATLTGGGAYTATTNAKGIYALANVPSASTYTVRVTKSGYTFPSQVVNTGTSTDNTITTGNVWGVDFKATSGGEAAIEQLLLVN